MMLQGNTPAKSKFGSARETYMAATQGLNDNCLPVTLIDAAETSRKKAEDEVRARSRYKMARRARLSKACPAMPRLIRSVIAGSGAIGVVDFSFRRTVASTSKI